MYGSRMYSMYILLLVEGRTLGQAWLSHMQSI